MKFTILLLCCVLHSVQAAWWYWCEKGLKLLMVLTAIKKRFCLRDVRCRRLLRNLFLNSRRPSKCLDSPCTFKAKNIWKKFLVGHPPNPPPTSKRGHQLMVRHNFAFELNNSKIFRCRTSKHSTSKFNFDASGLTEWLRWRRMTKKKKENS